MSSVLGIETISPETRPEIPFPDSMAQLMAGLSYIHLRVRWAVNRARANGLDTNDEFLGLYVTDSEADRMLGAELGDHLWRSTPEGASKNGFEKQWGITVDEARRQWRTRSEVSRQFGVPMRLERVINTFQLNDMEVDSLLIAVAPEFESRYESLYAYLQNDVTKKWPTVDLTLNLLTNSFEEKLALSNLFEESERLLRNRLLIRFGNTAGFRPPFFKHYLRPAATLVQYLLGHATVDRRLSDCTTLEYPSITEVQERLPPEHIARLAEVAANPAPILAIRGAYGAGKKEAAQRIAAARQQPLLILDLAKLLKTDMALEDGLHLALRDGRLADATVYLAHWDAVLDELQSSFNLFNLLLDYPNPVILAGNKNWQPPGRRNRRVLRLDIGAPSYSLRLTIWQRSLDQPLEDGDVFLPQLANQFRFTAGQIEDVIATAHDYAGWQQEPLNVGHLFNASRAHSNQNLSMLAAKIRPHYSWADIVLPADTMAQLKEMVASVRGRPTVYNKWGFGQKLALGKGLNALFAGESGTGKTMAADVMAGELGQDLYKIDLSMLVSKYIGETEKNLNRIFSEAATSNAILFFDEADAVFGKRSEVKDSHDRYANIEISYLLQRMEAYDGVVILATNLRANLDEAFTRRLHFIIEFPFPDAANRERIWKVNLPPQTPVAADVDFQLLAGRFRLAGGNIRNILVAAAFLAAESGETVNISNLLHAARREYQKIGRLLDEDLFTM
jgi:hypothetical protein